MGPSRTFAPVFKVIVAMLRVVGKEEEYGREVAAMVALYWDLNTGRRNCGGPHDVRKEMGPEFVLRTLSVLDPNETKERSPDNDR